MLRGTQVHRMIELGTHRHERRRAHGFATIVLTFVLVCSSSTGCDDGSDTTNTTTTFVTSTTFAECRRDSDCQGIDCYCEFAVCHCISTTTLTSTTTTTTTLPVASSTTSTTLLPCLVGSATFVQFEVTFSVTNDETLGALQYEVDYSGAGVVPSGSGGTVSCNRLAGDFAAFNDIESAQVLTSAFISAGGFTGPVDVATCTFDPGAACLVIPRPEDFVVTITDQSRPDFTPARATVAVTRITSPAFKTTPLP